MIRIALLLLLTSLAGSAFAQTMIPGTKISLSAPQGLASSNRFPGYLDEESGTSILVTEIPGPITETSKGLSDKALAAKGITVNSRRAVSLGETSAVLLGFSQVAYDIEFSKWMVLFGDESVSVLVTASYQKELEASLGDAMRKALLSVRWHKDAKVDRLAALTFRIKAEGDLRIAKVVGNAVILTRSGIFPDKTGAEPTVIVAPSLSGSDPIDDRATFARTRALNDQQLADIEVLGQKSINVGGLPGESVLAKGVDKKNGNNIFLNWTLLFDTEGGYYALRAKSLFNDRAKYEDVFEKVIASFEKK